MAYGNMFPVGYQPAYGLNVSQQNVSQQSNSLIWVQGEAGAKSYMVAPGGMATLFDTESQTIYIKTADAVGMPSMKILDYTIRDNTPHSATALADSGFATKEDVDILKNEIAALRAKFGEIEKGGAE